MKILLSAAAMAMALTALAGCSGDDHGDTATDPATKSDTTTEPTDPPDVGSYPELDAADYTYLLEQQCYCPLVGPVKVTVEDGAVTSSVVTKGGHGMQKGTDAPSYLHLAINDVIARANDTSAAEVVVDWPDGQDWPNKVSVDQIGDAVDDEVTYVISDVQVQ
jgi:hypothetical protein